MPAVSVRCRNGVKRTSGQGVPLLLMVGTWDDGGESWPRNPRNERKTTVAPTPPTSILSGSCRFAIGEPCHRTATPTFALTAPVGCARVYTAT